MRAEQEKTPLSVVEKTELSSEELQALVAQKVKERTDRCTRRIAELLDEENCTLDVSVVLTVRGMVPQVAVISKG